MKRVIVFLLIFITPALVLSQSKKFEVKTSDFQKIKELNFAHMVDANEKYYYTLGNDVRSMPIDLRRDIVYKKYDINSHHLVKEVLIEQFKYKGERVEFHSSFVTEGVCTIYYQAYDSKEDSKYLIYRTIDKDGNLSEPIEEFSYTTDDDDDSYFKVKYSADDTKKLVFNSLEYVKGDEECYVKVKSAKNDNVLWSKKVVFNGFLDDDTKILNFKLSNDGAVFFLLKQLKNEISTYHIFKVDNENSAQRHKLDLTELNVFQLDLALDAGNRFIVSGTYSNKGANLQGGVFFESGDLQDLQNVHKSKESFGLLVLKQFLNQKQIKKKKDLINIRIVNLVKHSNGGATLILQEEYARKLTQGDNTDLLYDAEGMILVSFNAKGKVEWMKTISKSQSSSNDRGIGASVFIGAKESDIYIIFSDNPENKNVSVPRGEALGVPTMLDRRNLVCLIVNPNGEISKHTVLEKGEADYFIYPVKSQQFGSEGMVFYGARGRQGLFGTISW